MPHDYSDQFQFEGALDVPEAERILPRLRKENILFQIQTDGSNPRNFSSQVRDGRIRLFVHTANVDAWRKIRAEYFPV
jgi:hypothetical protein